MAKRERVRAITAPENYFTGQGKKYKFVSSGCSKLDCDLGGGWALGRIVNVVGDKSTSKTGLGMEAVANFLRTYPKGAAAYRDIEAAFDDDYARAMGIPVDEIDFGVPITTVEEFSKDFDTFLNLNEKLRDGHPGIYVLDSLDALSDSAEMARDLGDATYGTAKAKLMSEFFRTTARLIEQTQVLLLVISQVRDNIGAMMGEKHKRSGGRSLDFYASQILWLARVRTLKRTINKVERPYGIMIRGQVKKNKVGLPFRECEFPYIFGYGIDDIITSIAYLKEVGQGTLIGDEKVYLKKITGMNDAEYHAEAARLAGVVREVWAEVETTFLPTRRKYG
jgi:protein RecA